MITFLRPLRPNYIWTRPCRPVFSFALPLLFHTFEAHRSASDTVYTLSEPFFRDGGTRKYVRRGALAPKGIYAICIVMGFAPPIIQTQILIALPALFRLLHGYEIAALSPSIASKFDLDTALPSCIFFHPSTALSIHSKPIAQRAPLPSGLPSHPPLAANLFLT